MKIYFDFNDWWIGYYHGANHHYICLLPTLVFRWKRAAIKREGKMRGTLHPDFRDDMPLGKDNAVRKAVSGLWLAFVWAVVLYAILTMTGCVGCDQGSEWCWFHLPQKTIHSAAMKREGK